MTEERLTRLETRMDQVVSEIATVRARSHDLSNKVHELGVLFQEGDDSVKNLFDQQKELMQNLNKYVTDLMVITAAFKTHQEQCAAQRIEDRVTGERWHQENQSRLKRLEAVYWTGIAVIAMASFFGLGQHILTIILGRVS